MRFVRHLAVASMVVGVVALAPTGGAGAAPGPNSSETIVADWGDATFVAKRFGWFVRLTVTTDEYEGEASCVYAKATLDVAGGPDPTDDHIAEECSIAETTTQVVWFRPGLGTHLRGLRIALCQPDFAADSCASTTMPVWQNLAERLDLKPRADDRMTEPMADFIRHRNARVGPWDWDTDGCSGPALRKVEFRRACLRHDFGYRNYGHGLTVHPMDATRAWIDELFLADMNRICARNHDGDAEDDCRSAARTNYLGVRVGGARAFFGQA